MIRQILGSARLIIQILLVVAAVILIYSWNPMNVFGGKAELKPTANMVSEIREIGEMITAEYYGEVLTSIDEVQIDFQKEPEIAQLAEATYDKIAEEIINLRNFHTLTLEQRQEIGDPEKKLKRRDRKKLLVDKVGKSNVLEKLKHLGDWEQTSRLVFFDEIMTYIYLKQKTKSDVITEPLSENRLRKTLENWHESEGDNSWNAESFTKDYFASKLSDRPRKEARKKLAMIGRGTVKAGFDFEGLQSHMYYLNEEVGELHIFGLAPKILNADINPWFIPEKGVPGFDLLTYNGKVDFKDSRKVKIYAVQKLKTNAIKAGIIEQAELNGGQTISRLINLLTEVEVKKVIFHHDELIDLTKEILEDRFISFEEASLFEYHIKAEIDKIDSLKLATEDRYNNRKLAETKWNTLVQMLKQLQTCEFESQSPLYNNYSTLWYSIREDGVIDKEEWLSINAQIGHKTTKQEQIEQLWVENDTLQLKSQFNEGLYYLFKDSIPIGQYIADTLPLAEWNEKIANDTMLSVKEITFLSEDTIAYQYFDLDNERRQELLHRIGLEKFQPQDWQEWIANKESVQKITKADTIKVLKAHPSQFWVVNKNEPEQIFKINIPLENLTYPLLLGLQENKNGKTNLEIGNLIIFKSSNNYLKEIDNPNHSSDLSQDQLKTLETHLIKLYTEYNAYHNRDFLTKANRWFTSKMESKSGILDKFK
ncbi:DUF4230 domain-containing protein [Cyclobacterium amurskyense]|uniref:Uncharacterized protein n=1 Tax=Cyclobacterium amurskyense TaxID=320787 RepID=A0A0H4PKU4_9BACT|nr:DUF4230 domain-containing protein [Cyclobacterium amurskyense]AKP53660.1 hypothetical protein CA2015_4315 [Cyclobacterium amurskyense]